MRLPPVVQSIRFRLTVLYSVLLFASAALALAGIYITIERTTNPHPITDTYQAQRQKQYRDGSVRTVGTLEVADVRQVESAVNFHTLETLRRYSFGALGGLFVLSLGVGWVLSGRVLRPVRSIAQTAAEIQATDLSRRIRLGGARDELRSLADTVDSMLDRLDSAFRAQRQLIDDVSHELRSPLAIIRTNVDAALAAPDATEAERERAIAVVDRATTRMSRLVEDLLATARRDAPELTDTDMDLGVVAHEAGEEYAALAAEHDLRLRYAFSGDLRLIGDPDAVRRAVTNLLSNAFRFAPPASVVTLGAGRTDGWVWLAVRDSGPGIPPDDQSRVFDRFWRGERDRTGRTGLGLAIVRQIVESHGGHVALHSTVGEGSTFVLWFPGGDGDEPPPTDPLPR